MSDSWAVPTRSGGEVVEGGDAVDLGVHTVHEAEVAAGYASDRGQRFGSAERAFR